MAQLVGRTVPGESRWQVQWKPTRESPGRSQTKRHVLPKLGDLQLARLSRSDVEAWVARLLSTLAPKTLVNG